MNCNLYGTLGPGCAGADTLEAMFAAGMTGVRLNLSHVGLAGAAPALESLHTAAARAGVRPQLLIDLQGPELRIGALPAPLELTEGAAVLLGAGGVPVPQAVLPFLLPGQQVLLDDGKLLARVTGLAAGGARAQVLRGGLLRGKKSIALPGAEIEPPTLTDADRANLALARGCGVTAVMQPFVRGRADLEAVRRALADAGAPDIRLLAKIENQSGVDHLDELIPACDEIVIARGDLGNAVGLIALPALQKRIAARCRRAGRPFMVVTQLLASMEEHPVPTRAEVSDIFNAVLDGAASLMVTGETAVGRYPVQTMQVLAQTAAAAADYLAVGA